jgi:hypothetical protein
MCCLCERFKYQLNPIDEKINISIDYIGYIVHLLKFVLLEFHSTNMVATRLMINMSTYNNG